MRIYLPGFLDVLNDLLDLSDAKFLFTEHVTEGACVVGTTQGRLYQ